MKIRDEDKEPPVDSDPKKNAFQRIQAGVQRMNRGKAKGFLRNQKEEKQKEQKRKSPGKR
jgi:hypothetical protein